jgi:uncharacterized protein (TIGR03435 family)
MRFVFSTLLLFGAAGAGFAQKASFDVASVKASPPQQEGRIMSRVGGDPGMIDYNHVNLRMLVQRAFGVKDYQVVGPDWMSTVYFDVQAKLPPDTPQEKRNEMMQTLLEERFGLRFHKESKEVPIYALVVAKGGLKMKEVEAPPQNPGPSGASGGNVRTPNSGGPPKSDGPMPAPAPGMMMMRIEGAGRAHLQAGAMQIKSLTDMISRQVDRPVIDETGLTKYYDVELEFKPEGGMMMRGMPMPMPRGDGAGGGSGPAAEGVEAPSIFTALQDQLGLKLESKRGPIETIVVDRIEKTPIEN